MEIDQPRHHRLAGHIDHPGILGPIGAGRRQDGRDVVPGDDDGGGPCRSPGAVPEAPPLEDDRPGGCVIAGRDRNPARIVGDIGAGRDPAPPLGPGNLTGKRRDQRHGQSRSKYEGTHGLGMVTGNPKLVEGQRVREKGREPQWPPSLLPGPGEGPNAGPALIRRVNPRATVVPVRADPGPRKIEPGVVDLGDELPDRPWKRAGLGVAAKRIAIPHRGAVRVFDVE